jgi:hypothetical protein
MPAGPLRRRPGHNVERHQPLLPRHRLQLLKVLRVKPQVLPVPLEEPQVSLILRIHRLLIGKRIDQRPDHPLATTTATTTTARAPTARSHRRTGRPARGKPRHRRCRLPRLLAQLPHQISLCLRRLHCSRRDDLTAAVINSWIVLHNVVPLF